ncbi:phytanoyl-CoA dioxygenase family protein [Marinicellulosiphila megalodicopiae]|uniref:phytanoyl-CoA dioxygenase family protein n=1 Tax=Marinicellulosiphila megalodicopiae TaxID=2724896 RepID=UPI003BAEEBAC
MKDNSMQYNDQGYVVIRNFFTLCEMDTIRNVILKFHEAWKTDNKDFYETEAFNSSLITGSQYLNDEDRLILFNFISSKKMMTTIESIITATPAFMNTQLFFNPFNKQLKTFWHRDCQYDFDLEDQKRVIFEPQVMHLRVPIFDELGMQLVPGTHKRWDTMEELDVRMERKNRTSCEELSSSTQIKLDAGDLLLFSADMIHRGVYGLDRLAFDILVFDSRGNYADYVDDDCLPNTALLEKIHDPRLFLNTMNLKTRI